MAVNYYISSRFFRPKKLFPFWVFPFCLLTVLALVLGVTLFITQQDTSSRTVNKIAQIIDGNNQKFGDLYTSAVDNFRNGSYYTAIQQFKSISSQTEVPEPIKQSSKVFYAYSMFLEGSRTDNRDLLRQSHDTFIRILREGTVHTPYFARVMLGYCRTTRMLGLTYNIGTERVLHYIANSPYSQDIIRQIYLEMGYYYYYNNNLEAANRSFIQAKLPIYFTPFLDDLVSREGSERFLLSLLENRLISQEVLTSYTAAIKPKLFQLSMDYIKSNQDILAKSVLYVLAANFSDPMVAGDINFLLGFMAQRENRYQQAISYYERVINDSSTDKYPATTFYLGVLYYDLKLYKQSLDCFNLLVQKFPYGYYTMQAQKWIDYYTAVANTRYTRISPSSITVPIVETPHFIVSKVYHPARPVYLNNTPDIVVAAPPYQPQGSASVSGNNVSRDNLPIGNDNSPVFNNNNHPVVNVNIEPNSHNTSRPYSVYTESQDSSSSDDHSHQDNSEKADLNDLVRDMQSVQNPTAEKFDNPSPNVQYDEAPTENNILAEDVATSRNVKRSNVSSPSQNIARKNLVEHSQSVARKTITSDRSVARQNVTDDESLSRDFSNILGNER